MSLHGLVHVPAWSGCGFPTILHVSPSAHWSPAIPPQRSPSFCPGRAGVAGGAGEGGVATVAVVAGAVGTAGAVAGLPDVSTGADGDADSFAQ